jgi:hypothetical protein
MEEIDNHMERKAFLSTAAGIGGILAGASAALAAPISVAPPVATMVPRPGVTGTPNPSTWHRNDYKSNRNIRNVRRHLEHVIDELSHDQHDYGGHRVKALELLNQARSELLLAEQAGQTH